MKEFIKNLSNDELIKICNEIYEWKYNPKSEGNLDKEGLLKKLYFENKKDYGNIYHLADEALQEAHDRFGNLVKLLFLDKAFLYIK